MGALWDINFSTLSVTTERANGGSITVTLKTQQ